MLYALGSKLSLFLNKWVPRVGLAGVGLGCTYTEIKRRRKVYARRDFWEGSPSDSLMDGLATGDVILFNRPVLDWERPWRGFMCLLSKMANGSEWDHVAVVVRLDEWDIPYVFENTFAGVRLTEFDHRILHSKALEITSRPLQMNWTLEQRIAAQEYINTRLRQQQEEDANKSILGSIWDQVCLATKLTLAIMDKRVVEVQQRVELNRKLGLLEEKVKKQSRGILAFKCQKTDNRPSSFDINKLSEQDRKAITRKVASYLDDLDNLRDMKRELQLMIRDHKKNETSILRKVASIFQSNTNTSNSRGNNSGSNDKQIPADDERSRASFPSSQLVAEFFEHVNVIKGKESTASVFRDGLTKVNLALVQAQEVEDDYDWTVEARAKAMKRGHIRQTSDDWEEVNDSMSNNVKNDDNINSIADTKQANEITAGQDEAAQVASSADYAPRHFQNNSFPFIHSVNFAPRDVSILSKFQELRVYTPDYVDPDQDYR